MSSVAEGLPASAPAILLDAGNKLFVTRCLTVAAVMIILYDTALSFEAERKAIWKSKMSAVKTAYALYRYLMVASTMISLNSSTSATSLSTDWVSRCAKTIIVTSVFMFTADAVGHCLVIFRTFMLWERKPQILRLLCLGSIVLNITALSFLILCVRTMSNSAMFNDGLKACAYQVNPRYLLGVWLPQVVFDIYVVALIVWNVMDRPRLPSQKILKVAYEDGLFLILATWVLRMINVGLCIGEDDTLPLIAIACTESLIATINLRLLLRIFLSESGVKNEAVCETAFELEGPYPSHDSKTKEHLDMA
ncbi:hypothetical protein ACEPAI_4286 [Sanghuangporus weigelae]